MECRPTPRRSGRRCGQPVCALRVLRAPSNLEHGINRELYPVDEYPAGQWDYQLHYYENFDQAQRMEQDPER